MLILRVAVINYDSCKPSKCAYECINFCPVNRSGSKAIEALSDLKGKPAIYEDTCIGCSICVKKCPFDAISIVNLPDQYEGEVLHRYGVNGFKLYGYPIPKQGRVTGIIGKNGTGKSTLLKIFSNEVIPNLGDVESSPDRQKVLENFKGREIFDYFKRLYENKLKVVHKIQYIELVSRMLKGRVGDLLAKADQRGKSDEVKSLLMLDPIWNKEVQNLSGGEMQKLLIAAALLRDADVYIFDEPSSYLDIRERLRMARGIRELTRDKYVIVVEHDLVVLDYLSDVIHIVYGEPSVYGKISKPYSSRVGINYLILGYLPAENIKFREDKINFELKDLENGEVSNPQLKFLWTNMKKSLADFRLEVNGGEAYEGQVIGIVGPNGIGKTTFIRMLVGDIKPDEGGVSPEGLTLSYKPQRIAPNYPGTVREFLYEVSQDVLSNSGWFYSEVTRKFNLHKLLDAQVKNLSGGELQKLMVAASLAKEADIYVLDEPSSYLDVEERYVMAKALKRVTIERRAVTFVVEHDIAIHDYVSDKLMVFRGEQGKSGNGSSPMSRKEGMNTFLKDLDITFRRDPDTGRPRVNKLGSYLDKVQKEKGEFYFLGASKELEE